MGNMQSILCCSPSCCSTRRKIKRPASGGVQSGLKKTSEHPKVSDNPKSPKGASLGNGGSQCNVSGPATPLNINDEVEKVQREINVELQIKDGAEKLKILIKNENHLQDVDELLQKSTVKLEQLYGRLEYLNALIAKRDALRLSGVREDCNEEKAVLPAEEAGNEPQVPNVDEAGIPVEEAAIELDVLNTDNVSLPEPEDGGIQQNLPMSLEDFRCCSVLGRGGFGKVLLAEYRTTKKMFAIKAIKKVETVRANNVRGLMYEKNIFQTASRDHHPFVVSLFASFQSIEHSFFVMEYAAGGDLNTQIQKASGSFSVSTATFYTACVVLGLEYLHGQKIIHRDLKLENVVLDNEGFAKITDFGLSKEGIGFGDRTKSFCGTLHYMAPEMLIESSYTRAVDWWSLGVMMYVMLLGEIPFSGVAFAEVVRKITSCKIQYPPNFPLRTRSILNGLMQRYPSWRFGSSKNGAEDVKKHFFFQEIDWIQLFARKLKPPFVPTIQTLQDTNSFQKGPILTPQQQRLTEEEQEAFLGFDWVADWMD